MFLCGGQVLNGARSASDISSSRCTVQMHGFVRNLAAAEIFQSRILIDRPTSSWLGQILNELSLI
jgi:hypothetical protein